MSDTDKILPALFAAMQEFGSIEANTQGQIQNRTFRYVNLADLMQSVRPILQSHGLFVHHVGSVVDGACVSESRVVHAESGQYVTAAFPIAPGLAEKDLGKAITYVRRYCTMGLLGIVADEDRDSQDGDRDREPAKTGAENPNQQANTFWRDAWSIFDAAGVKKDKAHRQSTCERIAGACGFEGVADIRTPVAAKLVLDALRAEVS